MVLILTTLFSQIDEKHRIFKSGQTVVDLVWMDGAAGLVLCLFLTQTTIGLCSWLLVAGMRDNTRSTFLKCCSFNALFLLLKVAVSRTQPGGRVLGVDIIPAQPPKGVSTIQGNFLAPEVQDYVREFLRDPKRGRPLPDGPSLSILDNVHEAAGNKKDADEASADRTVDVVLSDMSAPWAQTTGFWKRSLSDPYYRMVNTSGTRLRDHVGSMVS